MIQLSNTTIGIIYCTVHLEQMVLQASCVFWRTPAYTKKQKVSEINIYSHSPEYYQTIRKQT